MTSILQMTFSNTSGHGLPPVRRFAITWNDNDITLWWQMESLGCKELNKFKLRSSVIVCRVCNSNVTALLLDGINHCYQFWKGNKHTCGIKRGATYVWNHGWKWMYGNKEMYQFYKDMFVLKCNWYFTQYGLTLYVLDIFWIGFYCLFHVSWWSAASFFHKIRYHGQIKAFFGDRSQPIGVR